jgi:hypothetical protein
MPGSRGTGHTKGTAGHTAERRAQVILHYCREQGTAGHTGASRVQQVTLERVGYSRGVTLQGVRYSRSNCSE